MQKFRKCLLIWLTVTIPYFKSSVGFVTMPDQFGAFLMPLCAPLKEKEHDKAVSHGLTFS
jgi:hypothetical protein